MFMSFTVMDTCFNKLPTPPPFPSSIYYGNCKMEVFMTSCCHALPAHKYSAENPCPRPPEITVGLIEC